MDDADASSSLSPFYYHQHHHNQTLNGLMFSPNPNPSNPSSSSAAAAASAGDPPGPLMFPHSVGGRASAAPEPVKRKRGRPRKYGVLPSSSLSPSPPPASRPRSSSPPRKKDFPSLSSKKAQLAALGNAGQGFTPHVIMVPAGEDVAQNIMAFVHKHKRVVCILSASGSISNASLCQSAMLGGSVAYEGRFEILSLSGSFLHMEIGGASTRTGGLNVCLADTDGGIVGGGVSGPLIAAGPVQVILGSFLLEPGKNVSASSSRDNSGSKSTATMLAGASLMPPVSLRSCQESPGRMTPSEGSDDHPGLGGMGSSYMFQSQASAVMPSRLPIDWRGRRDAEYGRSSLSRDDKDEEHFRD